MLAKNLGKPTRHVHRDYSPASAGESPSNTCTRNPRSRGQDAHAVTRQTYSRPTRRSRSPAGAATTLPVEGSPCAHLTSPSPSPSPSHPHLNKPTARRRTVHTTRLAHYTVYTRAIGTGYIIYSQRQTVQCAEGRKNGAHHIGVFIQHPLPQPTHRPPLPPRPHFAAAAATAAAARRGSAAPRLPHFLYPTLYPTVRLTCQRGGLCPPRPPHFLAPGARRRPTA